MRTAATLGAVIRGKKFKNHSFSIEDAPTRVIVRIWYGKTDGDDPNRICYAIESCLWADIFRKLGESDLGYYYCAELRSS